MDPIFIGCSWLRSPKSFTRGSRPFFHCGGGSVERAVAHYFLIQRRRSPSAHLVRRNGGTHCSQFHYGCLAVPFPVQIQIAVAVAPLLCLVPQRSFSVRTSAFTFAPLVARNGGTPCWIPFSSAVPGFALRNRGRTVDALSLDGVEGPLNVR